MRKENKLVEESLAFVKAYMADKSNDNYGSHYRLELDYAYEDGQKDGIKEGKKAGIKEGKKEGIIAVAKKMIENNYTDEEILKISGLTLNKINSLRKEM